MKYGLLLMAMLATFVTASAQNNTSIQAVSEAFAHYKKAMVDVDGETATTYLSKNSLEYYNMILDKTLNANKEEVEAMSIVDKTTILGARHKLTKEVAREMDGKAFFMYAIEGGLIGKDLITGLEIANIDASGTSAQAEVITNGIETGVKLGFAEEGGAWKIDITSIYSSANQLLSQMIKMMGQDEDEFVMGLITRNTGEKPTANVWIPLNI